MRKFQNMGAGNQDAEKGLGFSFRRLALVLLVLLAFRGATGGIREFVVTGDWLAGIFGVVVVGVIGYWIYSLYVGSDSRE